MKQLPTMGTTDDLSAFLSIPKPTLEKWRHQGDGPAYIRLGKHVRYRSEDVEAWLAAQQRGGAA